MSKKRKIPEINTGSTADMAFLLLIFYLVTTTMNVDSGILRKLPPPKKDNEKIPDVKERNVFVVLINKDNQLAIKGEFADISELKGKVKEFISNPSNKENLSEQKSIEAILSEELQKPKASQDQEKIDKCKQLIQLVGNQVMVSQGLISLQNDRGTSYGKYLIVSNEIVAAINELRDDVSKQIWGSTFDNLSDDKQELVKFIYPYAISEAEPRKIGGNNN